MKRAALAIDWRSSVFEVGLVPPRTQQGRRRPGQQARAGCMGRVAPESRRDH